MNAVEIEQAISELAEQSFDATEFPYSFLEAFGNPATTIQRLRNGSSNKSDIPNGVLQRTNIHIATCQPGQVLATLGALKNSTETTKAKAKFILATDGDEFHAEDLNSGEIVACDYSHFANHFGFFLPLAGISTVKQIRDNPIDIQATGRLNRLYVELLKHNEDWATAERRHDMNQFMGRLIFCFFAEDTDIFNGDGLFTKTIEQMSDSRSDNTDYVLREMFRAMDTKIADRAAADLPRWADAMPYVNGGLFDGTRDVPKFTRAARSYLIHAGNLNWREINPDIFGSMIQAVADEEERGALGMHYTSVPNILKVLKPLFLDDLRDQLKEAGDNGRKLLNLRKRMSRIRVFDPACGSGNFLVIAYKEMRAIEAEINQRRDEMHLKSEIPLSNFRGIEIREFPAEIARLSLIIAEFQCDVLYRGQKDALKEFLPLDSRNWIVCGNALRLDWLSICPPTGTGVKHAAEDLFHTPLDQTEIEFENEGGETFICGNPPYKGSQDQSKEMKEDLSVAIKATSSGTADYVFGWFFKGCEFIDTTKAALGFVTTNSIHQGRQVAKFWPYLLARTKVIHFARPSFLWSNLATNKAAVTVSIIGIAAHSTVKRKLFDSVTVQETNLIGPYLQPNNDVVVGERRKPLSNLPIMNFGSMPNDSGHLIMDADELRRMLSDGMKMPQFVRPFIGTTELTSCSQRYCLWFPEDSPEKEVVADWVLERIDAVRKTRANSSRRTTQALATVPHRFGEVRQTGNETVIAVGGVSTEAREYLPATLARPKTIVSNLAYSLLDAPLWSLSIVASKIHKVWIIAVCGKMRTHHRYSNTLGWNTFPLPALTEKNKADLTRCAEDILLAREAHFPSTIADLYDPENMPEDLRAAHDRNDEVLERIYIGRRFKNDTERLEKLFDLYTKMTSAQAPTEEAS